MAAQIPQRDESGGSDQRYLPRWHAKNRILYQLDDEFSPREGYTKDLNCAGTCILIDRDLSIDQKLKLTIFLAPHTAITVHGNVIWSKQEDQYNEIGINFQDTTDEAQELILQYAFELNKSEVLKHWYKGWDGE